MLIGESQDKSQHQFWNELIYIQIEDGDYDFRQH